MNSNSTKQQQASRRNMHIFTALLKPSDHVLNITWKNNCFKRLCSAWYWRRQLFGNYGACNKLLFTLANDAVRPENEYDLRCSSLCYPIFNLYWLPSFKTPPKLPCRWLANSVHLAPADYGCTPGCMQRCTGTQSNYSPLLASPQWQTWPETKKRTYYRDKQAQLGKELVRAPNVNHVWKLLGHCCRLRVRSLQYWI